MDSLDLQLLYMISQAEAKGEATTTWALASQQTKSSMECNRLDGIYRYRLEQLTQKGLLTRKTFKKRKQKITEYHINPKKFACVDGSLFIFANPITVLLCPHIQKCPSKCKLTIYKQKDKIIVQGCKLLQNADENIKRQVYEALK